MSETIGEQRDKAKALRALDRQANAQERIADALEAIALAQALEIDADRDIEQDDYDYAIQRVQTRVGVDAQVR